MPLPPHLPFDGNVARLRMGLRPLDPDHWVEVDDDLVADLNEKRRLLESRHDEVVAFVDDDRTRVASRELLDRLVEHLTTRHPDTFLRAGPGLRIPGAGDGIPIDEAGAASRGWHLVEVAGRLTQEDWCVMLPDRDRAWRLAAAAVCFPTRWVMPPKLGQDLHELHGPVAHYDRDLGRGVDSFFDRLTPGTGKWRNNWNVVDDPERFQPRSRHQYAASGPHPIDDVPRRIWLRVERQTLVRLPVTGAVVFGIRVHQDPLHSIADAPDVLERLGSSLRTMTPEAWSYKSLDGYGADVLAWIDGRLAALTS